ncbi:uncharacterized protein LOC101535505 [Ochotona princeps]|uniref:uncharacterized protein LOC101535505 n=1 Tax=Ochotona princeps TaxID=9978 RepID=UPI0027153C3B|nr:uncharacterized protein LOC101535505 [Ochotona princeps]
MGARNMSWIRYPSQVSPAVEDVIASQSIVSRCAQVYLVLCVPLSLAAGLFNLTALVRDRTSLGALSVLLLGLTVTSLLGTLLSLSAAGRPDYLLTTNLGCAALCFLANICYFHSQYLQLAMCALSLQPGSPARLLTAVQGAPRPAGGLAVLLGCALCSSLVLVALLGTAGDLHKMTACQLDLLAAWPEYEIVKFSLGLGLALAFKLGCLILCTVPAARQATPALGDLARACPVVPALALTMLACRLPYNAALLRRASLKLQQDVGSPRHELFMSLAELLLGGESCASSLATLALHPPCRQALLCTVERLTRKCRGRGAECVSLGRMKAEASGPPAGHSHSGPQQRLSGVEETPALS